MLIVRVSIFRIHIQLYSNTHAVHTPDMCARPTHYADHADPLIVMVCAHALPERVHHCDFEHFPQIVLATQPRQWIGIYS